MDRPTFLLLERSRLQPPRSLAGPFAGSRISPGRGARWRFSFSVLDRVIALLDARLDNELDLPRTTRIESSGMLSVRGIGSLEIR